MAPLSVEGTAFHAKFTDAIDDDLDLPQALATVREALRSDLADDEKRWLALDADLVLGLDLHRVWDEARATSALPAGARELLDERAAARSARDYGRADELRGRLMTIGVEPVDRADA